MMLYRLESDNIIYQIGFELCAITFTTVSRYDLPKSLTSFYNFLPRPINNWIAKYLDTCTMPHIHSLAALCLEKQTVSHAVDKRLLQITLALFTHFIFSFTF